MEKIKGIMLDRLTNAANFEFHHEHLGLLKESGAETSAILSAKYLAYRQEFEREDEAFKKIIKSVHTDKIHELVHERAVIFRGICDINKMSLMLSDIPTQEAAKRMKIVLDSFKNIAKTSATDGSALVENLMQELDDNFTNDVATVGIGAWVRKLKAKNDEVREQVNERYDEEMHKTNRVLRDTRKTVDKAYRAVMKRVDAFREMEGTTNYIETYIRHHNMIVEKYRLILTHHHSRKVNIE